MPNAGETSALEKLLRPLSQQMRAELAEALIHVKADRETQARYDQLAEKRNEGSLTPEELTELESMVRANTLLGILQAQARSKLGNSRS
jgi:hypothetical protein